MPGLGSLHSGVQAFWVKRLGWRHIRGDYLARGSLRGAAIAGVSTGGRMTERDIGPVAGLGLADAIGLLRDELLEGSRGGRRFGDSVAGGVDDGGADGHCHEVC